MEKVSLPIKRFYNILFISLLCVTARAQAPLNYQEIYKERYADAIQFLDKEAWIRDSLLYRGVDPDIALAVVFPEILRFSVIRNWAETKSLEVLYSQYGENYADFSIGRFQMKPSFACDIETDWNKLFTKAQQRRFNIAEFDSAFKASNRYQRTLRLNDLQWEVKYLVMFMLIMDKFYSARDWKSREEKLLFYATAYNTGYNKGTTTILKAGNSNDFHTAMTRPAICYNYGDIALDFYRRYRRSTKN